MSLYCTTLFVWSRCWWRWNIFCFFILFFCWNCVYMVLAHAGVLFMCVCVFLFLSQNICTINCTFLIIRMTDGVGNAGWFCFYFHNLFILYIVCCCCWHLYYCYNECVNLCCVYVCVCFKFRLFVGYSAVAN